MASRDPQVVAAFSRIGALWSRGWSRDTALAYASVLPDDAEPGEVASAVDRVLADWQTAAHRPPPAAILDALRSGRRARGEPRKRRDFVHVLARWEREDSPGTDRYFVLHDDGTRNPEDAVSLVEQRERWTRDGWPAWAGERRQREGRLQAERAERERERRGTRALAGGGMPAGVGGGAR